MTFFLIDYGYFCATAYRTKGQLKTAVLNFFDRLPEFGQELASRTRLKFHVLDSQRVWNGMKQAVADGHRQAVGGEAGQCGEGVVVVEIDGGMPVDVVRARMATRPTLRA